MAFIKFDIKEIRRNWVGYADGFKAGAKKQDCHCFNCKRDFINNETIALVKFVDIDMEDRFVCDECANSLSSSKESPISEGADEQIRELNRLLNLCRGRVSHHKKLEEFWERQYVEERNKLLNYAKPITDYEYKPNKDRQIIEIWVGDKVVMRLPYHLIKTFYLMIDKIEGQVLPFELRGDDIEMITDALGYITSEREDILSYLCYLRNEIAEFKEVEKI